MTIAQSLVNYGNGTDIVSAKLVATYTGTITFYLGVSNNSDGTGITWEAVSSGSIHSFTTTGKWLYWKADGSAGAELSYLTIQVIE